MKQIISQFLVVLLTILVASCNVLSPVPKKQITKNAFSAKKNTGNTKKSTDSTKKQSGISITTSAGTLELGVTKGASPSSQSRKYNILLNKKTVLKFNGRLINPTSEDIASLQTVESVEISNTVTKFPDADGYQKLKKIIFETGSKLDYISADMRKYPNLESVVLPASIAVIKIESLSKNPKLHSIEFEPQSQLQEIDDSFSDNPKLTSIIIPKSVQLINKSFINNKNLTSVTFETGSMLKRLLGNSFKNSPITTVYMEQSLYDKFQERFKLVFPNASYPNIQTNNRPKPKPKLRISHEKLYNGVVIVHRIGWRTQKLKLVLNDNVTHIKKGEYDYYSGGSRKYFTDIDLRNVKIIDDDVFAGHELQGKLIIPDSVVRIGARAFSKEIYEIFISGSGWVDSENRNHIKFLVLGKNVETIEEKAFNGNKLTEVVIPNSVQKIGDGAFTDNPLRTVTLSKKLYNELKNAQRLESVFGDSVTQYIKL